MATSAERKALLFFGIVITLGAGARAARVRHSAEPTDAAARQALETQLAAANSARHAKLGKEKGKRRHTPAPGPSPQARVDMDIASEAEIVALRGVGPSLAHRIFVERDSFGPFGSLEGLKRVRGIGPATVAKLDSTVTFSLLPRPMNTVVSSRSGPPKKPPRHRRKTQVGDTPS